MPKKNLWTPCKVPVLYIFMYRNGLFHFCLWEKSQPININSSSIGAFCFFIFVLLFEDFMDQVLNKYIEMTIWDEITYFHKFSHIIQIKDQRQTWQEIRLIQKLQLKEWINILFPCFNICKFRNDIIKIYRQCNFCSTANKEDHGWCWCWYYLS